MQIAVLSTKAATIRDRTDRLPSELFQSIKMHTLGARSEIDPSILFNLIGVPTVTSRNRVQWAELAGVRLILTQKNHSRGDRHDRLALT